MGDKIENAEALIKRAENITCVSDYLDVMSYINNIKVPAKTLFFRGASDKKRPDEPSIYRKNKVGNSLIKHEQSLYYEIISKCPENFKHCKTTLDHLVVMQHYGLPTRLLDVTENPLVALFFACKNHRKRSPAIVSIYDVFNSEVKNFSSDTASLIANLVKMDADFSANCFMCQSVDKMIREMLGEKNFDEASVLLSIAEGIVCGINENGYPDIAKYMALMLTQIIYDYPDVLKSNPKLSPLDLSKLEKLADAGKSYWIVEEMNHQRKRLIHFIKDEKPYFDESRIDYSDFSSVLFVKTKQDNPNIIRQNGAFMLFGVKGNAFYKKNCAVVEDRAYMQVTTAKGEHKRVSCIIKQKYKKNILKELDSLSISDGQLFPDINNVATYLKGKYDEI